MYQAHHEQIGDFLLCGKGIWRHTDEENKEIVFHDSKGQPEFREQGPPMHHFRSSRFHSERLYLERKWNECLARGDLHLPVRKVKVYGSSGDVAYTEWYKVFLDDPWPLEDCQNDEQCEDSLQCPDTEDTQGLESVNQESLNQESICTDLLIISNIEEAELSDNECDEVHVDASDCGKEGADDVHSYGDCVSGGGIVENTEDVINSHEATLRQVEDHGTPDTSKPGDSIDQARDMLETKLATSVSKLMGVTPLVKTLDKARKALHKKENCQNMYYHNKYKDTLASVQTQVLAVHQKYTEKIEKWEREFVVKNGFAPTFEHFQSEVAIMTAYKKKKLSKELLKHWKITVHEH